MPQVELAQLHAGQLACMNTAGRFNVLQCGRRWGKTTFGEVMAEVVAINGGQVGWFAPTYKYLLDVWRDIGRDLKPIIASASTQERRYELTTGGVIDFWTMDTPDPGRGRKYKLAILDECGIVKGLTNVWQEAIRPTLTDYRGEAWMLGTPKGRREFHTFFQRGEQGNENWKSFRRPTRDNPRIDPQEIEEARRELPEQVFRQEFEGIPADDGGNPFGMSAIAACVVPVSSADPVVWGIDLAKSVDWTVLHGLDANGVTCRHHRFQATWNDTIGRVAGIVGDDKCYVDSTGVGDPVLEGLIAKGCNAEGFKFSQTSKQQLMEGLAVAIQTQAVGFPDGIIRQELETFEYEFTLSGRVSYSSPAGLHDDCVCALALAVHGVGKRPDIGLAGVNHYQLTQAAQHESRTEEDAWKPHGSRQHLYGLPTSRKPW
jgi:hypothetical protein